MELTPELIYSAFEHTNTRPISVREIMKTLNIPPSGKSFVLSTLQDFVHKGKMIRLRREYFMLPNQAQIIQGVIHVSALGKGFVLGVAEGGLDLYVQGDNLGQALDGDTVEVEILTGRRGREEGRVRSVVKHAHEIITGLFQRLGPQGGTVTPRNVKINRSIITINTPPPADLASPAWVRVKVEKWSANPNDPLQARVIEFIGLPGDKGIQILTLLRDQGVNLKFPEKAITEANDCPSPEYTESDSNRLDLRKETILTIDPITAKDFDDGLSVKRLDNGNWQLGVHIADVAEYVRPATALDDEALLRATSIYPVDRVVPMLPERLSNDLCSLRPNEDRFALSCIMEINKQGEVVHYSLHESVICSARRLNYGQVQELFNNPEKASDLGLDDVADTLLPLLDLAHVLNKMRMDRGALDLDLPEKKITCNKEGDPISVSRYERFESNRLVEECMLIANEVVARHFRDKKLPCLYRIHVTPDPSGLERAAPALAMFGVRVPKNPKPVPETYQPIVDRLNRVDGGHIGMSLVLRTLARAEYSTENREHFGLASTCYCHFTSPIRRYPDLLVHRVLKTYLRGEATEEWLEEMHKRAKEMASHCNLRAENAESIERQASDIKAMEFMKDQEGGTFEGWISHITRRGFFVELVDYPVEGYVNSRTLPYDQYRPNEYNTRLIGGHTGLSYRLGQKIQILITSVRIDEGEMDLELVMSANKQNAGKNKKKKKGKGPSHRR